MKNAYTVGRLVYLRAPTEQDAEGRWHEWLSDEETTHYLGLRYLPNTVEDQIAFLRGSRCGNDRLVLAIVDQESDRHIGVCNLSGINWVHRYADIALIIGESEFRTGPYTIDALSLLLRVAFQRLNLRLLKSYYVATNEASEVIHHLFRFQEVGRIPEMIWDRDQYVDYVTTALRRENWQQHARGDNAKPAGSEASD